MLISIFFPTFQNNYMEKIFIYLTQLPKTNAAFWNRMGNFL